MQALRYEARDRPPFTLITRSATAPRAVPVIAVVALFSLVCALLATRDGPAVTPDSVQYLSTAHHIARGEGATTSVTELTREESEIPLGPWPPLYPALLGGLMRAGFTPFTAPRALNLGLVVATLLILAGLAGATIGTKAIPAVLTLHALTFYPTMLATFAWSELTYIALSLGSLALLCLALRRESPSAWILFAAGGLAGAAMLTRYIGFTLVGAAFLGIWMLGSHRSGWTRLRNLASFALPAGLPNALWLIRNQVTTGHYFGEARPEAWFDWDQILVALGRSLAIDWIAPTFRLSGLWASAASAAGLVGVAVLVILALRNLPRVRLGEGRVTEAPLLLLWLYAVIFLIALVVLSRRVGFDPINTRYLAPVYPVLLLLSVALFRGLLTADRRRPPDRWTRALVLMAVALWAVPQLLGTSTLIARAGHEERNMTAPYWTSTLWADPAWEDDPGLARLHALAGDGLVISNVWDMLGVRTGLATKNLPETSWPGYPDRLWDFPGALVAVYRPLRTYRATAEDLTGLAHTGGRLEFLEASGEWSFFRIREAAEGAS